MSNELPAMAPESEWKLVGLAGGESEPGVIALKGGGVRQEVVRDEHRLRPAKMRVRRHRGFARPLGLIDARGDEAGDQLLQRRNATP